MDKEKPKIVNGKVDMVSYCCQDIAIPPVLPGILKQYTKGALRTQPRDLLLWSAGYFRTLTKGEIVPVKDRLEDPLIEGKNGLTPGLLRVINHQVRSKPNVTLTELREKWVGICMKPNDFDDMVRVSGLGNNFQWDHLLPLAASTLGKSFSDTMRIICVVISDQPPGREPYIKLETWWKHYTFLGRLASVPEAHMKKVYDYLYPIAEDNFGAVGPNDFLRQECPELTGQGGKA